jgi:SIT4-associating protein SAP185/190
MFWRFGGYANISTIDTLLEKPDVTLEEILDESELMQELKQPNTKLIEYLREDNVLKRLLSYVISPSLLEDDDNDDDYDDDDDDSDDGGVEEEGNGAEDGAKAVGGRTTKRTSGQDGTKQTPIAGEQVAYSLTSDLDSEELANAEKSRLKYSFIASEVLSSTSWSIIEALMQNEAYLRDFWQFLWRKAPLDSLQSGYFTKVNEILLDQKTEEMLAFFKSLPGIVLVMLQHIDNPMVMDLLLKIISLEKTDGGQGIVEVSAHDAGWPSFSIANRASLTAQNQSGYDLKI